VATITLLINKGDGLMWPFDKRCASCGGRSRNLVAAPSGASTAHGSRVCQPCADRLGKEATARIAERQALEAQSRRISEAQAARRKADAERRRLEEQETHHRKQEAEAKQQEAWKQFADAARFSEAGMRLLMGFVGQWPAQLQPADFAGQGISTLLEQVREYQGRPHPKADTYPEYQVIDGQIGRASNDFLDLKICVAHPDKNQNPWPQVPGLTVFQLIRRYSEWPLSKLVFALPRVHEIFSIGPLSQMTDVPRTELMIEVYKGVEIALFDVYEALPNGRITDAMVEEKLKSLAQPSESITSPLPP